MPKPETERRSLTIKELRATTDGGTPKIAGYAAVFGVWSEDLGGFRESIQRGAFASTIKTADVRALLNHDANHVLGRTKSGTLSLREDDTGLWFEVTPPDTQVARDLLTSIQRGDIDQMSFGFRTVLDDYSWNGDTIRRVLQEVELLDVSPVTYPAYPQTSASVRSHVIQLQQQHPNSQAAEVVVANEMKRQAAFDLMSKRLQLAEIE